MMGVAEMRGTLERRARAAVVRCIVALSLSFFLSFGEDVDGLV